MKKLKNKKVKLLFSLVVITFIYFLFYNVNAYEIRNMVTIKEDLYSNNDAPVGFPEMVYKKQVSAYATTIKKYKHGWDNKYKGTNYADAYNIADDNWVYSKGEQSQNELVDDDYVHNNPRSFVRVYEYFHKYQNSNYNTTKKNNNSIKYYSTGNLWPLTYPLGLNMIQKNVYEVTSETDSYTGLYWQRSYKGGQPAGTIANANLELDMNTILGRKDQPIVLLNSNLYRYAVTIDGNQRDGVKNVYVSDNILENNTVDRLWEAFGEDSESPVLEVYNSSVLRTSQKNSKNNEQYWKHMDTAFKFWETTVNGYDGIVKDANNEDFKVRAWKSAPSITGVGKIKDPITNKEESLPNGASSVINYYDNTYVIPKGRPKIVYVRHIDVTGLSEINSTTIKDAPIINEINNGQIIVCGKEEDNGKYKFIKYQGPESRYKTFETENDAYNSLMYNEKYQLNPNDYNWYIGNIKYSNYEDFVDINGNSKTLTYLNPENGAYKTEKEQDILNNYNCVGRAMGTGESIENAILNKDINLDSTSNLSSLGEDWSNVPLYGDGKRNYIVIDFYYEKKPTEVYVRHIDVNSKTNISDSNLYGDIFIQTNKGVAFKVNDAAWDYSLKDNNGNYITFPAKTNVIPDRSEVEYQEHYTKYAKDTLRIVNIKYNTSTAGSYWNLLDSSQKNKYNKYYCIGAAVGKGSTADVAEVNKNTVKKEQLGDLYDLTDFINLSSNGTIKKDDRLIAKGDDTTSIVINNNDYNVVVIDFYYVSEPPTKTPREVYVRHIDMTEQDEINSNTVQKAVSSGSLLPGNGKAIQFNNGYTSSISATSVSIEGYKEKYGIEPGYEVEVSKYNNEDYNCVGSNISGSLKDFDKAKSNMDSRLENGQYSSSLTSSRKTNEISSDNVVILVDFYYKSKHTGTALRRPTKGRLSFYTISEQENNYKKISGKDSTGGNINNPKDDNVDVIDIVPSGESLKMSIDNAYTYMLGGINVKEQKIQDTYTFDYTITQNYTVNYLDWYGECAEHGIQINNIANTNSRYTCEVEVVIGEECSTSCSASGCTTTCVDVYGPCGKKLLLKAKNVTTNGSVSRTYRYQIPYEYTFYKVKNMRIYTISKIELLDDYSYLNIGLPLFDGKTHIVSPKSAYTNSFNSDNTTFTPSSSNQTNNRTSKTLTTLTYYFNNTRGDVSASIANTPAINNINEMFNNVTHSMAADMDDFIVTGTAYATNLATSTSQPTAFTYNGINSVQKNDRLRATLYVKNDEISFKDGIKNNNTVIVGEGDDTWSNDLYKNGSTEKNAIKFVDLVEFTRNKIRSGNGTSSSPYTYTVDTITDTQKVSTQYPKSIRGTSSDAKGSKYLPTSNLTNKDYYKEEKLDIPITRLNGKRYSYGKIYYNLLENGNNKLNFDANNNGVTVCNESNKGICHDWNNDKNRTAVAGGGNSTFVDTEMYNTTGNTSPRITTFITPTTLSQVIMSFGDKKNSTANKADVVNVFTPISFNTWLVTGQEENDKQVNHSNIDDTNFQIQKNSRFTIAMEPTSSNNEYPNISTDKYVEKYYIKFNFDVQDVKIYDSGNTTGRNYNAGAISAGTWIGPIYHNVGKGEAKVAAFALADPNYADKNNVVNQETNSYTVKAVAYNAPEALVYSMTRNKVLDTLVSDKLYNRFTNNNEKSHNDYYDQKNIEGHNNYVAEETKETQNLNRVYDFKVTDLKDLDWKDIFRKSTSTSTNVHTSKAYYSGVKKWNVYTTKTNERLIRDSSEIGPTKQQILPLGPYKHINNTYTDAPKLGYKFSFDLKTTGSLVSKKNTEGETEKMDKKVIIEPEFYYISKETNGDKPKIIEKNIDLYYKNSNNKYVSIKNYNLYFVPDDGYRLTFEGTDAAYRFSNSNLSKSTVKLGNATKLILTTKMMEEADSMFVQIWYGEYKLPNSTIAVRQGDNINNKLTNGYIGVKFNIKVEEYNASGVKTRVLNYSQNDKNTNSELTNTSQWDYEGYLGYNGDGEAINGTNSKGEKVTARIALKGGSWILEQEDYEFVKGTVILYDTDAKASSDYN